MEDNVVFMTQKVFNSDKFFTISGVRNAQVTLVQYQLMQNKQFSKAIHTNRTMDM